MVWFDGRMYTIKQAAARSGVSVQLVRAWERRYGVVEPTRTASGYRLYDDDAIARLRAMRRLDRRGLGAVDGRGPHSSSMDDDGDPTRSPIVGTRDSATRARAQARGEPTRRALTDAFVDAAAALDERGVEQALDEMFARGSFEQVAVRAGHAGAGALGDGWAAGTVGRRRRACRGGRRPAPAGHWRSWPPACHGRAPVVLVGLPPGARHDLGALAFATAARRAGHRRPLSGRGSARRGLARGGRSDRRARPSSSASSSTATSSRRARWRARSATRIPSVLIAFGGRAAAVGRDGRTRARARFRTTCRAAVERTAHGAA